MVGQKWAKNFWGTDASQDSRPRNILVQIRFNHSNTTHKRMILSYHKDTLFTHKKVHSSHHKDTLFTPKTVHSSHKRYNSHKDKKINYIPHKSWHVGLQKCTSIGVKLWAYGISGPTEGLWHDRDFGQKMSIWKIELRAKRVLSTKKWTYFI